MTAGEAIAFVHEHGVVLVSAKGPVPRLVEAIAGEQIQGSWWAHPKGQQIFAVLQSVADSPEVLVCRLVDGKITLVHRRVWPALVRLAARFPRDRLAQVRETHTPDGHHENQETPFPAWVPADVKGRGMAMSQEEALELLGSWNEAPIPGSRGTRRRRRA